MSMSATLSIMSDVLRPEEITKILKSSPDNTVNKGNERSPPRQFPKFFGWYIKIESIPENDIDIVLRKLISKTEKIAINIENLVAFDPFITIRFTVSIRANVNETILFIDNKTIKEISKFNGNVDIEFFED